MTKEYKLLDYKPIEVSEIPTIELYMDQVLTFLTERIKPFCPNEEDKILTKTMVNNYVKSMLIEKPSKKKYNSNHIKTLIMIYHFKNVISIKQIGEFLQLYKTEESCNDLYNQFLKILKEELSNINNCTIDFNNKNQNTSPLLKILRNIIKSDIHSRLAESALNSRISKEV